MTDPGMDLKMLQVPTVAQKTVQVFACFGKIVLVQNANIIQGPDFLVIKKKNNILASQNILDHVI